MQKLELSKQLSRYYLTTTTRWQQSIVFSLLHFVCYWPLVAAQVQSRIVGVLHNLSSDTLAISSIRKAVRMEIDEALACDQWAHASMLAGCYPQISGIAQVARPAGEPAIFKLWIERGNTFVRLTRRYVAPRLARYKSCVGRGCVDLWPSLSSPV